MNLTHLFRLLLPVIVVTIPIALLYQSCGSTERSVIEYVDVDGEATDASVEDAAQMPGKPADDGGAEDLPAR